MSELLQLADLLAREKMIERDQVLTAIEHSMQTAARKKYGEAHDIRAEIDRRTGEVRLRRFIEVVDLVENEATQLTPDQAQRMRPDAKPGDIIIQDLPKLEDNRIFAQTVKQVLNKDIRDAERERQFNEYKDRIGEVVSGTVKRVDYGNVTVELGRAEAVLKREECIPREIFKPGDRVRAYMADVRQVEKGPQIFLSRTVPGYMAKLFEQEVPEIYDGIITIKSVARDPGSRAKIAVVSRDSAIDPIGACVGMRGSRVQAVVAELQGEKVDIIPWSQDPATFVVNALAPAEVSKVVLDEQANRIEVVVPDEQLSLAIGRRGQNVRLASMLTGWDIDILREAEESERRQKLFNESSSRFMLALDVDELIASLLVTEGFSTVDDVALTPVEDIAQIQGFDIDVATELQNRALAWLERRESEFAARRAELGVADDLLEVAGMTSEISVALGEAGVKTADDLADLATDELVEILGEDAISREDAEALIMTARQRWFGDEVSEEVSQEEAEQADTDQ